MAQIVSGATSDILTVDPTSKAARFSYYGSEGVELARKHGEAIPTNQRALLLAGMNDSNARHLRTDRLGSMSLGYLTPLFYEPFEGTVVSAPNRLTVNNTTMTATQADVQGLLINSGAITTINTGYLITSNKRFSKQARAPLQHRSRARMIPQTNAVMEIGFGQPATFNGANTVGAYFQVTTAGVVQGVMTFNSVDTTTTAITGLSATAYYIWDVLIDDDFIIFTVQDSSTGLIVAERTLQIPLTQPRALGVSHIGYFARVYVSGVAPAAAPQMHVTDAYVGALDTNYNIDWLTNAAILGLDGIYNPTTFAQTEQFANSAEPASATLSNTAAGYATLGGKFQFAAVAGAVTDYALFGFQIPAPYQFLCTGIDIDLWVTGAASATTPTLLHWFLSTQGTTVSLADANSRRKSIGSQSIPVGAAIGANVGQLSKQFQKPIACDQGKFFDIGLRMPVGTATASQVIAGSVAVHGLFI